MKVLTRSLVLLTLLSSSAFAAGTTAAPAPSKTSSPAAPPAKAEPAAVCPPGTEEAVKALIPPGFTVEPPTRGKTGELERVSYFAHKGEANRDGFYAVPLILVETVNGKVVTNLKVGSDFGWTGVRRGRSVGLGDPHHDVELKEFTNGKESRVYGFLDGSPLEISRNGQKDVLVVKPSRDYEVQVGTANGRHAVAEIRGKDVSVYLLNGTTFMKDEAISKAATAGGLSRMAGWYMIWTSRLQEGDAAKGASVQ